MDLSRIHPGHALLAGLLLASLVLGWRALSLATAPLPAAPPFGAPALADRVLLARFDPFFPAAAASGASLPVTALPFSLHGLRADSATGRGSAIIAAGDGQQLVYGVGDSIGDGVTLAAIAADHVVLDRGGTRETLWLDNGGTAPVGRFDPTSAGQSPGFATQPASGLSAGQPDAADAVDEAPPSVMPDDPRSPPNASASGAAGETAGDQP